MKTNDNVALLQKMLQKRPVEGERCDFCATPLGAEHGHVAEVAARRILCACRPCYLVFEPEGAGGGRYRNIPTRFAEIEDFALDDAQWESLAIPIGLAFFFQNSLEKRTIAFYPSPAGATESLLPLDTWNEILAANLGFASVTPDVEAVLIRRTIDRREAFIVPIDSAYELVGIIRSTWKGFDGGEEARARIDAYFERIRARGRENLAAPAS